MFSTDGAIGSAGKIIIEDPEAVRTAYKEMLQKAMEIV